MEADTHFVIGDVHGQHTLLKRLLQQEGLLDDKGNRIRTEVRVIQLGDLGHFARYKMGSQYISARDDWECFELILDRVIDEMVWGNHDRALVATRLGGTGFSGFTQPKPEFMLSVHSLEAAGKIKLATTCGD